MSQSSRLAPHLAAAYRATPYSAAGQAIRIGRRSRAIDGLLAGMGLREAVLITAWNPHSQRMPLAWNERMMRRLRDRLGRYTILPAQSGTGLWRENQLLVGATAASVAASGRHFRQNAMVRLRRAQPACLVTLT
jgi:hypothetical protein